MFSQRIRILMFSMLALTGCDGGNSNSNNRDTTPPTVTITASVATITSGGTVELTISATENATLSISCDQGTVAGTTFTAPTVSVETTVTCTVVATDAANNQGTATVSITITPVTLSDLFPKQIDVFGVKVMATQDMPDHGVRHAAAVMAEYLDNDEDGTPDNQALVDAMVARNAAMIMATSEDTFPDESMLGEHIEADSLQAQFGSETIPNGRARGQFDATLEEVLHLISHVGLSDWNENVFGERIGSVLADAMDIARGGQFTEIPQPYPDSAWYTYDDDTCDYSCMVTEYFYWGLTSLLGAQDFPGRDEEIADEWNLNTATLVEADDTALFTILSDASYTLPTRLPNGIYTGGDLTLENGDGPAGVDELFAAAAEALPGYKIAFGDERRIWMMNADGSGLEELFNGEESAAYVSWGPRAEYVYFASTRGPQGTAWEAWRVNVLTKEATQMTEFGRDVRSLGVSPDGRYLAISVMTGNSSITEDLTQFNTDLYIMLMEDAQALWDEGERIALDDMQILVSSPPAEQFWYEELHWNPVSPNDGEEPTLGYTQTWRYDEDDVSYTHAFTIKADGTDQSLVQEDSDLPIWDFSGTRMVFLDLEYFDFNYGEIRQLNVSGISDEVAGPAVSPDGQFIVFEVGDENRRAGLAYFSSANENPGVIYPDINVYEPKWSPRPVNSNPAPLASDENVIGARTVDLCISAGQSDQPACFIVEGTDAHMYGVIDKGIEGDLTRLLNEFPDVTTVALIDVPGSFDDEANLAAGRALFAAGLNTQLEATSSVASGGVDFFLAGVTRTIVSGAELGVHSWLGEDDDGNEIQGRDLPMDDPQHQPYIDYYTGIEMADPSGFYFFTLNAADADNVHLMTAAELEQWRVAR